MQPLSMQAALRESGKGEARRLRRGGLVPGVVYGRGGPGVPVVVGLRELLRSVRSGGRHTLLALEGPFEGPRTVVVKDIQYHPTGGGPLHVDFLEVSLSHRLTVAVPVFAQGVEALEEADLVVQHQARELEIECLPTEIPDHLTVDVRGLKPGDQLLAGEVPLPPGARMVSDPDTLVLSVLAARVAPVEVPEEAPEPAPETGAAARGGQ